MERDYDGNALFNQDKNNVVVDNPPDININTRKINSQFNKLSLASRSISVPAKFVTCNHVWIIHNFRYYNEIACKNNEKNNNEEDDDDDNNANEGDDDNIANEGDENEIAKTLFSTTFSAAENNELQWYLALVVDNISEDHNYCALYLQVSPNNGKPVVGKYKLSILNSKCEEMHKLESHGIATFVENGWGSSKFIEKDFLLDKSNGLLPDDNLTIYCEVSVVNLSEKANPVQFDFPKCELMNDIRSLFENQKFCDVTLDVAGTEFRAHKAILAVRSPVFHAMFEHKTKENQDSRVDITDIDHQVAREMLRFMYTGEVSNLEELADGLLAASDKYGLERLKVLCEDVLCLKLNVENAVEIVILAELHSAYQLKMGAINFITIHAKDVMDSTQWKSMHKFPSLITEILRAVTLSSE